MPVSESQAASTCSDYLADVAAIHGTRDFNQQQGRQAARGCAKLCYCSYTTLTTLASQEVTPKPTCRTNYKAGASYTLLKHPLPKKPGDYYGVSDINLGTAACSADIAGQQRLHFNTGLFYSNTYKGHSLAHEAQPSPLEVVDYFVPIVLQGLQNHRREAVLIHCIWKSLPAPARLQSRHPRALSLLCNGTC